ncbi:collagen alpha-2(I) chain-like [Coccinella septempunctata]|uniref:collagen alpha-2(I) chain-like n=1 Tax=Coccinella septempunctata TaxID=41139 RepID=UPI001D062265|nr:collagen alpha-2(I) chain-like [Coccinella septempunctata]
MEWKVLLAFSCCLVASQSSLIPTVEVLQGPSSKTTLLGPDGSALNAAAPGGTVVTGGAAGLVPAGPAVLGVGAPIAVRGPAGAIITSHSLAGPAVVPAVAAGAPIVGARGIAIGALGDPDDNGHEGAYLGDISEAWHDDGSYRGE